MTEPTTDRTPPSVDKARKPDDERALKKDRLKFALCAILDRGEENSLGGIPTVFIKSLGGNDFHLGLWSSTAGLGSLVQVFGSWILRWARSDRRAMVWATYFGVVVAALVSAAMLGAYLDIPRMIVLWAYLALSVAFAASNGLQLNIETAWIGDRVPARRLGWFNSYKYILTTLGSMAFILVFGKLADRYPGPACYSLVYGMFVISSLLCAVIYATATDRTPKTVHFLRNRGDSERIRYGHPAMWCYILFYWCWTGGRTSLFAFSAAYLIEQFHFSMTAIAWMSNVQMICSIAALHLLGKIVDRGGNLMPLLVISAAVALSMALWISSAWLGIVPIIVYQVVSGAAGNTHSMVAVNLALEVLPEKGRAAYLGFSRLCIGLFVMIVPALAGLALRQVGDFTITLWGATLNRYHLLFTASTLLTLCCVIPLLVLRRQAKASNLLDRRPSPD